MLLLNMRLFSFLSRVFFCSTSSVILSQIIFLIKPKSGEKILENILTIACHIQTLYTGLNILSIKEKRLV